MLVLSEMQAESWAFAVDLEGLKLLVNSGVFRQRTCKLCNSEEGIVVASEYGLANTLLAAGYNLATLMSR